MDADTQRPLDHLLSSDDSWPGGDGGISVIRVVSPTWVEPKRMLNAFVRIEDGSGVLNFARRFGVLELCAKGDPLRPDHRPNQLKHLAPPECIPKGWPKRPWHERVDHWLKYVREADGVVKIGSALRLGQQPAESDWDDVLSIMQGGSVTYTYNVSEIDPIYQYQLLGQAVDHWLMNGHVRPSFWWSESGPVLGLTGNTFGTIGIQLMFTLTKALGVAVCSGCGRGYLRQVREPQRGRKNFCPRCGERVASRLRKRAERARRRE